MRAGIYIHIPFCASKCRYCDFFSVTDPSTKQQYVDTALREISRYEGQDILADTLFFGGGTPSLMDTRQIGQLVRACRNTFGLKNAEITMEANPDSVSDRYLSELREIGVNRISFGAQSAVDCELSFLGRRHNAAQIGEAVRQAKNAGFSRISLDIMLAIPFQTSDSLRYTLETFCGWQPEHLSAYLLKIEEGTPFFRENVVDLCPDEDAAADFYLQTVTTLEEYGFSQYEISNFAKPGGICRHNLKYWQVEDYIGIGPAAHSCLKGQRFYHPRGIREYLETQGNNLLSDGPGNTIEERLMLGLRLTDGVELEKLGLSKSECEQFRNRSQRYIHAGYMKMIGNRIALTPSGFLISNTIFADLLQDFLD
ncbi:MAG: radical SAM family heme chaperone HemW [Candidatus Merdivicinus sp.]|jgi:oxygen-independent coproporphyrinogen-3 oxidase